VYHRIIFLDVQELVVWSSGSDEGENCDVNRKYSWCSTGSVFPETELAQRNNWLDGPGLVSGSGRCLAMAVNASAVALTHADCSERKPFLCQVPSIIQFITFLPRTFSVDFGKFTKASVSKLIRHFVLSFSASAEFFVESYFLNFLRVKIVNLCFKRNGLISFN